MYDHIIDDKWYGQVSFGNQNIEDQKMW